MFGVVKKMTTSASLRNSMFLLREPTETISGNKLPTNKQVLKLLFYQTREAKNHFLLVINSLQKKLLNSGIELEIKFKILQEV